MKIIEGWSKFDCFMVGMWLGTIVLAIVISIFGG